MTELIILAVIIAFMLLEVICVLLIYNRRDVKKLISCANKKELKYILKILEKI